MTSNFVRTTQLSQERSNSKIQTCESDVRAQMPLGNCALLSPTCPFKKRIVATAEMWWVELAALGAEKNKTKKKKTWLAVICGC